MPKPHIRFALRDTRDWRSDAQRRAGVRLARHVKLRSLTLCQPVTTIATFDLCFETRCASMIAPSDHQRLLSILGGQPE
jgi:hypothetical protein